MSLCSVWTMLGTYHNLVPNGISERYMQETSLKFSISRDQYLFHWIRLWNESVLVRLCSLPQSKTTSNWPTTDTSESSLFWGFSGEYIASSTIHSCVIWLLCHMTPLITELFLVPNFWIWMLSLLSLIYFSWNEKNSLTV